MSGETSYRLRSDLVIEQIVEDGVERFVIKDPTSGRFFRIKPLEHFLIRQFDGRTSRETIRRRASEERRVLVSEDVLTRFAEKFLELGLLEGGQPHPAENTVGAQSALAWKLPLANPEKLLNRIYPLAQILCGPVFLVSSALTVAAALLVLIGNRDQLVFGLGAIFNLEGVVFVVATISAVTLLHELAHAVACRHFGGRVSDMGFLLLYLVPCFYVNVSDTYLLKERRQRLWVIFAGAYFELFLWAGSVLLWRLVAPETFLSRVLVIVVAVCGLRSLFNFNPLIKMDGYFLVSEALGIANLRAEAFAGLGRLIRRVLGLEAPPTSPELAARRFLSMPGSRFVTLFGAAALAYTAVLVGIVLVRSGGFVLERYGGTGFGVFALAMLGLLHKPAISAAESAKDVSKEKWEKLASPTRRIRFLLIWGGLLLLVAFFPWYLRVGSELTVLPQARETVRARSEGRIADIYFGEGDRVEAGDLLVQYDTTGMELSREAETAALRLAQAELALLETPNPTTDEEIAVASRALEAAVARENAVADEFERAERAFLAEVLPRETYERADSALREAQAMVEKARADLNYTEKDSPRRRRDRFETNHMTSIDSQHAEIERIEVELEALDERLERMRVYASISGTISTYRFRERAGDYLEEGDEVCEIVDADRVVIEMPVAEKEIDVIELGQDVKFKVRGYPGRSFRTSVDEIAPVAEANGHGSTILLRATVDNPDGALKPGMTGVAKVYCGMSFVAHILTRDLIRFVRTEFWL